jgi:hypothetical protein
MKHAVTILALAVLAALLALAGCVAPSEPTLIVRPLQIDPADECFATDPEFPALPDRDIPPGDPLVVRDRRAIKDAFETAIDLRAICRASLRASRLPTWK